jgi:lipid II isoglutaminyl synthase (glutamine-hydrolysing)
VLTAYGRTTREVRAPAILAGKTVSAMSRLLRRGAGLTYPGVIGERLHPGLIGDLCAGLPGGAIAITGTNGKTTVAKMLGDALAASDRRVVRNDSGSNLRQGIASTLIRAAHPVGGHLKGDIAVLEVDEATLPNVAAAIAPRVLCVTNVLRDQLDRYGDLDTTAAMIAQGIAASPETTVVLNADDPIVAGLGVDAPHRVIYFGVDDPRRARSATGRGSDAARCPACGGTLRYDHVYYGHLGSWACTDCGLSRPHPAFSARDIELHAERSSFTLVGATEPVRVELPVGGLHNVYNALAAYVCAFVAGLDGARMVAALKRFSPAFGRTEELEVGGARVLLMLAKNPSGAEQSLASVLADDVPKAIGITLNDHAADGTDVSWIWDVDFESFDLADCTFVVSGTRAEDVAVRLKYAGVDDRRLSVIRDPAEAVARLGAVSRRRGAYMLATYTAMLEIRSALTPPEDRFARLGARMRRHVR